MLSSQHLRLFEMTLCSQGFAASYVGEYLKDTGTAEKFNVGEYWVDLRCVNKSFPAHKSCPVTSEGHGVMTVKPA